MRTWGTPSQVAAGQAIRMAPSLQYLAQMKARRNQRRASWSAPRPTAAALPRRVSAEVALERVVAEGVDAMVERDHAEDRKHVGDKDHERDDVEEPMSAAMSRRRRDREGASKVGVLRTRVVARCPSWSARP